MGLIDEVENELKEEQFTIPELCRKLQVTDEFTILVAIHKLQADDKVKLSGYKRIFREDGKAIYLAQYAAINQTKSLNSEEVISC